MSDTFGETQTAVRHERCAASMEKEQDNVGVGSTKLSIKLEVIASAIPNRQGLPQCSWLASTPSQGGSYGSTYARGCVSVLGTALHNHLICLNG